MLYMQDYGSRVISHGSLAHPERAVALIVQNAVAHNEGLVENWKARRAFWADRTANEKTLRANLLSLAATRTRHLGSDPNVERYHPDLWTDEFAFLSQPGQDDIQSDLFYDYRKNVEAYPGWQAWMRKNQPACWWFGAGMTCRLICPNQRRTGAMSRMLKFTFSTAAISRWIPRPTRSPI